MKTSLMLLWIACGAGSLNAQGYLVPNGVLYGGYDPVPFGGYKISVLHDVEGLYPLYSPYTQFWLSPIGETEPTDYTNTFSFSELVDIQVRVFLVASNEVIALPAIQSGVYPELTYDSYGTYVFQDGVPFYVGLYSGAMFAPPYPPYPPFTYTNPVFGWALLVNNQGAIEFLDSALAYQAGGIYVGTGTLIPIPEPSSLALLAAGSLGPALRCRFWN